MRIAAWAGLVMAVASMAAAAEPAAVLADGGKGRAVLVTAPAPEKLERQAVKDLADYLERLTGARPASVACPPETLDGLRAQGRLPVVVGSLALEALRPAIEAKSVDPGAFALEVTPAEVRLAGLSPEATCYAAAELLEQLGVRWYMPGELGTVVPPPAERLELAAQMNVQAPSFGGRSISGVGAEWALRNRLGGITPPSALDFPTPAPFAEHPEYYALVDGQRQPTQLCVSNPEVLRQVAERAREFFRTRPDARWLPVSNHGGQHCECPGCRALDPPGATVGPFTGGINVTDRYIHFCNRLLGELEAEFPDRRLSFTMATPDFWPPVAVKGHPRLDVLGWPVGFCRLHGPHNPACPERTMALGLIASWVERLEGDYFERGNWGNVAGPGLLFPMVHRYVTEIPAYRAAGVAGFRTADYANWIAQHPSSYVGARLLWNHQADVEAILAEFYRLYYGPADAPMRAWHELLEQTMRDADFHTGTAIDFPRIYPADVRQAARAHLDRARQLAPAQPYADRLAALALALDYLDAFCAMIAHRDRHEYAPAFAALEQARGLIAQLQQDRKPPLLGKSFARPYLDLFFGNAVEQAHRLTGERGDLVAGFGDRWDFLLDPRSLGEAQGWHQPNLTGGNWQSIRAWTSSWSGEGLRTYEGDAWYRQSIAVPETAAGRPARLWFGAVDELARVWLNGHLLGDSPGKVWQPFELDATAAILPGQPNLLVIRVTNRSMDELGTGGLLAPVFLYSPRGE